MTEPYAIALVGVGKIARDQHLPAIAANPAFRLAATVDPHRVDLGVPHFEDIHALMGSDQRPDAVAICTPPVLRKAVACSALIAGVPVLLEKPPAAVMGGFHTLMDEAEAVGATVFTAWHSRFAAKVAEAKAWVRGRDFNHGRITWRESARKWHPGQRWLWEAGGFGVFDPAINAFSILTELLPGPIDVRQAGFLVPSNCDTPIAASVVLNSGSASIHVDLDFREEDGERWEIELQSTTGDRMLLAQGGAAISIDGEPLRAEPNREYAGVYAHFAELLAKRASDADARPLQLVADCFLRARWSVTDPYYD